MKVDNLEDYRNITDHSLNLNSQNINSNEDEI